VTTAVVPPSPGSPGFEAQAPERLHTSATVNRPTTMVEVRGRPRSHWGV